MITKDDMQAFQPLVVGICGAKAHGKDTAAQVLIDNYGFERVSFADGLRKTVCTALRCNESYFLDPDKKEEIDPRTGKSRRFWLQHIGTEGFRSLWEDVWVEWWRAEVLSGRYDRVVVTDLRFPNELAAIRRLENTLVLRITNPNKPVNNDAHASELHYASFDVDKDILNDKTIDALHGNTERAVMDRFGIESVKKGNYYGIV